MSNHGNLKHMSSKDFRKEVDRRLREAGARADGKWIEQTEEGLLQLVPARAKTLHVLTGMLFVGCGYKTVSMALNGCGMGWHDGTPWTQSRVVQFYSTGKYHQILGAFRPTDDYIWTSMGVICVSK